MVFHVVISLLIVPKEISAQNNEAYYTTTDLGSPNSSASSGNPFKGFLTNPDWNSVSALMSFPSSLDFYYIGLNDVMSNFNTFDWDTTLEVVLFLTVRHQAVAQSIVHVISTLVYPDVSKGY